LRAAAGAAGLEVISIEEEESLRTERGKPVRALIGVLGR
jgi:hypothetical protein